jgi:hypothetical protein
MEPSASPVHALEASAALVRASFLRRRLSCACVGARGRHVDGVSGCGHGQRGARGGAAGPHVAAHARTGAARFAACGGPTLPLPRPRTLLRIISSDMPGGSSLGPAGSGSGSGGGGGLRRARGWGGVSRQVRYRVGRAAPGTRRRGRRSTARVLCRLPRPPSAPPRRDSRCDAHGRRRAARRRRLAWHLARQRLLLGGRCGLLRLGLLAALRVRLGLGLGKDDLGWHRLGGEGGGRTGRVRWAGRKQSAQAWAAAGGSAAIKAPKFRGSSARPPLPPAPPPHLGHCFLFIAWDYGVGLFNLAAAAVAGDGELREAARALEARLAVATARARGVGGGGGGGGGRSQRWRRRGASAAAAVRLRRPLCAALRQAAAPGRGHSPRPLPASSRSPAHYCSLWDLRYFSTQP